MRCLLKSLFLLLLFQCTLIGHGKGALMKESDAQMFRNQMVELQLASRDILDPTVLKVMGETPQHLFIPEEVQHLAYRDGPLPIGWEQTISQPYIVAFMTQAAQLTPESKVLEIGTGSGYQAAILSQLCQEVFTIEIVEPLGKRAQSLLKELHYSNVHVRIGDGYKGWPSEAPYDAILLTAAPEEVPQALLDQLKVGGRLIAPIGKNIQELVRITKTKEGLVRQVLLPVRFVPMTGGD
ncbi:MAG: protein-L-isoaspartate(D-aspartate) O-methyltransferase [Alphaproteobacteria bacterium]|nr:protein-L-isoaspartate(D-aspartate) O-methyltransferase [Alphaproteobacteria bacterium]MBT5389385.1 protein-L-isoaspartate(D-aspartate) O-methyltransferase [Alphaproteobacteria bacterium]